MKASTIVKRVQAKLADPEGTYVTDEYVMSFLPDTYEDFYNKLRLSGFEFDYWVEELPNVAAGTPNLNAFMDEGQPLETLINPTIIEYKQTGLEVTYYERADGPLDYPRDIANGAQYLDSWSFMRNQVQLANFGVALDLRVTGEFTLTPLRSLDSQIEVARNAVPVLVAMCTADCAIERGNPAWITAYRAQADEKFDDFCIQLTKSDQGKTRRLARMSRRYLNASGPQIQTQ